ncbi:transcriptional regulator/antitoxin, MazE [Stanieria cyanosphaera PCC 7437]|uniref:Transcriptional regulator/antitoxin, MazE n=1 Tax=Stanieria cyanosphaera (strain ATCC 29371 / PCC 7437) TaxID=111780 RepID=K9XPV3_STAC7|nr:AbrB/MazE/SpoVT family DNA-binding domain-containing protein [Stanieria cyanosphaera]AFZ33707.1 transcriptional regulator/antitoxin, MazE [Stanieria cyanosphaera PCC 7437]
MSTVAKWGNSLAIRIPKNIADKINLKEGTAISIDVTDTNIVITPKQPNYTLEELLAGANSEDFEGEYDWGEPVGEEIWE